MGEERDSKPASVTVEISKDRLQAWVRLNNPADAGSPTKEEVAAALQKANVQVNEIVQGRIEAFISSLADEKGRAQRVLIAEGRPAVEPQDAKFAFNEVVQKRPDPRDDDNIDFYSFNAVVTVEAGAPIGTLTPAIPGERGVDVSGKTIEPRRQPVEVKLDATVRRADEDLTTIIAVVPGKIILKNGVLSICEMVTIEGDVDFGCGNIHAATDVNIKGTVLDLFKVKSKKSIKVGGAVQAAEIEAGGDVIVSGGILGRRLGTVRAGGLVAAKFAEEADIEAGGDVRIAKECMNCRVRAEGKFQAGRGAVIGGEVYAREGVEAGSVGSEAYILTSIIVGIHPASLEQADALTEAAAAKLKTAEQIRTAVQPLMANLASLTRGQRERAEMLLSAAEAMMKEIAELEARRDQALTEARAKSVPGVVVAKFIHAGSRIRIGRRHVVFENDLKGPVRIEKRTIEEAVEFVAVSPGSGAVTVLKSAYVGSEGSEGPAEPAKAAVGAGETPGS